MDENLDSKLWYVGQMSREDVEGLLKPASVPTFTHIIRRSSNVPELIISYKKSDDGTIAHRKINTQNGRYWSVHNLQFHTVAELVRYHTHHDGWILYDKFYFSHLRKSEPETPSAVPAAAAVDYDSSSKGSWGESSLDSGTTDQNSDEGSYKPLDENSMVAKLRRLLETRKSLPQRDTPPDSHSFRTEGMLANNSSNLPANIAASTGTSECKPMGEFYGQSRVPPDTTAWHTFSAAPSSGDAEGVPVLSVQSRIGDHDIGGSFATAAQVRQGTSVVQNVASSLSMKVESRTDRSDWSLAHSDVRRIDRLGAGNYGEVWKVFHVKSKKIFAMKTMKAATMKPEEFEREVKVMMTFRHPNLVKTYGVCSDPGESFILIDYLPNGSVIDYCKAVQRQEKSPLSSMQKYNIASDVLRGMKYLSEENLIHRDLAARNVLLADDLTAKVADFGLALLANPNGGETEQQGPMGTPWMWTAPEALRGRGRWSPSCDVWSYGVFCWELYTDCLRCPYQPELPNSRELDQFLKSGGRLRMPDSCHIGQLVAQCWIFEPESRPSFQDLHRSLCALGPPPQL